DPCRQGAALFRGGAGQSWRRAQPALDLLRGDRQDRGRAHTVKNLDQRTLARLSGNGDRWQMPDASDLPQPLPTEALPSRLLWRGESLPAEAGRLRLPADVEREVDAIAAALDRDPVPLLLLRPEDFALEAAHRFMREVKRSLDEGPGFAIVDRL